MADIAIGSELQQLPLGFLLSGPMTAAIEAQALAAQTTADFLQNVTLQEDPANPGNLQAVMIEFSFVQTVPDPTDPTITTDKVMTLRVPLMAITQIPFLRINDLSISFEFKIRDVQSVANSLKLSTGVTASTSSSFKGSYSAGGGIAKFLGLPGGSAEYQSELKTKVTASATYQRSERQETDRSATYKMSLNAVQDPIPEGMRRVLEIMANAIAASATV